MNRTIPLSFIMRMKSQKCTTVRHIYAVSLQKLTYTAMTISERISGIITDINKGVYDKECELKIKEDTQATSRCMPFEQEELSDVCVCCGKPAKKMVVWGKAY